MKKALTALLFLCLAGCATATPPPTAQAVPAARPHHASPPQVCDSSLDKMLRSLQKNAKYAYVADAIDSRSRVHMWYINSISRKWAQVRVYDDLHACIERTGPSWRWTVVPGRAPDRAKEAPPETAKYLRKNPLCDRSLDHMLQGLGLGLQDATVADVLDNKGHSHKWFVGRGNGFWADIRVYPDHHACIKADGDDWHWAVPQ